MRMLVLVMLATVYDVNLEIKKGPNWSQLPFARQETQFQESDTKDKGHDQQKPQVRSETSKKCPLEKCICLQFAKSFYL